ADVRRGGVRKNRMPKIAPMVTVGPASAAPAATATPAQSAPAQSAPGTTRTPSTPAATTGQQPPVKGMVWVNLSTKVYHKEGDRYYGNTKNGKFMTEDDAIKAGYRAAKEKKPKQ